MAHMPTGSAEFAEPAWDVALLFPSQGHWSVSDYLSLTADSNRLVELQQGRLEVLPMPTLVHQLIVNFLLDALKAFTTPRKLGVVVFAPFWICIAPGEFREPDIVFLHAKHRDRLANEFWNGANLMEVVSKDEKGRRRDLNEKRADYAAAGIPEYWIVDPVEQQITVLTLDGDKYATHGEFAPGEQAASRLLEGFAVDVAATFKAAEV